MTHLVIILFIIMLVTLIVGCIAGLILLLTASFMPVVEDSFCYKVTMTAITIAIMDFIILGIVIFIPIIGNLIMAW